MTGKGPNCEDGSDMKSDEHCTLCAEDRLFPRANANTRRALASGIMVCRDHDTSDPLAPLPPRIREVWK